MQGTRINFLDSSQARFCMIKGGGYYAVKGSCSLSSVFPRESGIDLTFLFFSTISCLIPMHQFHGSLSTMAQGNECRFDRYAVCATRNCVTNGIISKDSA